MIATKRARYVCPMTVVVRNITDHEILWRIEAAREWERANKKAIRRARLGYLWVPLAMLTVLAAIVELWRW